MVGARKLRARVDGAPLLCALFAFALLAACGSGPRVCPPPMYLYNGVCVVDFEGGVDASVETGVEAGGDAAEAGSQDGARNDAAPDAACGAGMHRCSGQCVAEDSIAGCGAACEVCTAPAGASAACTSGHCGWACNPGFEAQGTTGCDVRVPRPIAPLSTATTTSQRPTFHWALGAGTDGARIEICQSRGCGPGEVVMSVDVSGSSGTLPAVLRRGVWFWRLRGRVGSVTGLATSPVWEFTVGARSAAVDSSWGTTLDVNGDGYADVVVGAYGAMGNAGRVYVYLGGASGLAATPTTLDGPDGAGGAFGGAAASAGDVNGDGYADVIVGAPFAMREDGRAYVYLGSPAGLARTPATILNTSPGSYHFGSSVTSAGDVNGDGFSDVVVGAPSEMSSMGRAYVYLGGASGLAATPATTLTGPDDVDGAFGGKVAGAGDVNRDGYADVVVGAAGVIGGAGRAYVYLGSAAGLAAVPATTLIGPDVAGGWFGFSIASMGDMNGDGYSDIVVGAPRLASGVGGAYVYFGGASGLGGLPATTLTGRDSPDGFFGYTLASVTDVNGDGYADVVVGAPYAISGTGRAYAYLGGAAGPAVTPATMLTGPSAGDFTLGVATIGDINGDGYTDVVVGTPAAVSGTGRAYVYLGAASGLAAIPATTLTGPDGTGGRFGYFR